MSEFAAPQSRTEAILQNMLGANNVLGEPQSRMEELLIEIYNQGGGGSVTVDDALSATSENPVQNKVIYATIGDIETLLAAI